ncbi:MAG: carboxylating nicotinate-nucleotide diphosphorylase [Gammaproteobacteria bacterium]|nr:carboxylating nicotinate-nucleotide diphosphorylase [Gammaproteobacteria bacterium]
MEAEKTRIPRDVDAVVAHALEEDIGSGDVTAQLVPEDVAVDAFVFAREAAVICGRPWFDRVFQALDPAIEIRWEVEEGAPIKADQRLVALKGRARAILTGERTALNFLQTLSGTATLVRKFVERVRGTQVKIVDTRKTLPGLRLAQKYAVTCGGGVNHRIGLYDGILIKENHIHAAGSLTKAIEQARKLDTTLPLMAEAETLDEVKEALDGKVDILLLDDFPTHLLSKAVAMAREYRRYNKAFTLIEASGGINLYNVRDIADTGVDRISIGALTKNVQAVDLSLRFTPEASEKPSAAERNPRLAQR